MVGNIKMAEPSFDLARKQTKLRGKSLDAAKLVLVHGKSVSESAENYDISRQTVNRAVNRVKDAALRLGACPMCGRKC